jgi:hypothetical protein
VASLLQQLITKHFLVAGMAVSIILAALNPTVRDSCGWIGWGFLWVDRHDWLIDLLTHSIVRKSKTTDGSIDTN